MRFAAEFFLARWTEDLLKGELAQPVGPSDSDREPGDLRPSLSSSFSPNTVLADLRYRCRVQECRQCRCAGVQVGAGCRKQDAGVQAGAGVGV